MKVFWRLTPPRTPPYVTDSQCSLMSANSSLHFCRMSTFRRQLKVCRLVQNRQNNQILRTFLFPSRKISSYSGRSSGVPPPQNMACRENRPFGHRCFPIFFATNPKCESRLRIGLPQVRENGKSRGFEWLRKVGGNNKNDRNSSWKRKSLIRL